MEKLAAQLGGDGVAEDSAVAKVSIVGGHCQQPGHCGSTNV